MNVFVTGGNGFIGSVVVRNLVASGHRVRCLLRPTSRTERLDGVGYARVTGDVRDAASLQAGIRECHATVHLAAPSSWEDDAISPVSDVIEGGTRNILAAAREVPGHRVVLVSSTAAVNASETPQVFDETSRFTIDAPLVYAQAKHRAEGAAAAAWADGVPVVIVNPAEVYGPNDTALITAGNLRDFATASPVLVCNGGTSVVHVEDVAAGIIAALERGRPGERYILGGENITIRQLAELCLDLCGRHARVVTIPNGLVRAVARGAIRFRIPLPFNPHVVPYATRYWFMDNSKARRELGVTFRNARATIASTLDWMRQARMIDTSSAN